MKVHPQAPLSTGGPAPEHDVQHTETGWLLDGQPLGGLHLAPDGPAAWVLTHHGKQHKLLLLDHDLLEGRLTVRIDGIKTVLHVTTREAELLAAIGVDRKAQLKVGELKAPMPGLVRTIHVAPGDVVEEGTPLLSLEAMKMENVLKAPAAATVAEVPVAPDQAVEKGAVLIRFE